jgi:hypothetical protein
VTVGDERGRESVDARRVDTVVVGHEDAHRSTVPAGLAPSTVREATRTWTTGEVQVVGGAT